MYQSITKLLLRHQKKYLMHINKTDHLNKDLDLDKSSYFIITINRNDKYILVEQLCYNNNRDIYSILFRGRTAKYLCYIIFQLKQLNIIVSTAHALYLGRELIKAELALVLDQQYIQD